MATSDGGGRFKVERTGFTPPADCTVDVNDGSATEVKLDARLADGSKVVIQAGVAHICRPVFAVK